MGQPTHIRVVDDNGDVHDNHPGPGNDRVSRAPVSQNRRSGRLCHPRWSRITKLDYWTNDQVLDEVKQISFEGSRHGKPKRPGGQRAYSERTARSALARPANLGFAMELLFT
jgi:hypothetical protein